MVESRKFGKFRTLMKNERKILKINQEIEENFKKSRKRFELSKSANKRDENL